jgi:hypothetical protein
VTGVPRVRGSRASALVRLGGWGRRVPHVARATFKTSVEHSRPHFVHRVGTATPRVLASARPVCDVVVVQKREFSTCSEVVRAVCAVRTADCGAGTSQSGKKGPSSQEKYVRFQSSKKRHIESE